MSEILDVKDLYNEMRNTSLIEEVKKEFIDKAVEKIELESKHGYFEYFDFNYELFDIIEKADLQKYLKKTIKIILEKEFKDKGYAIDWNYEIAQEIGYSHKYNSHEYIRISWATVE